MANGEIDPGNDKYFLDGSILEKLKADSPGRNFAFSALSLTDAPVEIRRRFLDEYAQWQRDESDDPSVVEKADEIARSNVAYACGSCGSATECQRYLDAWQEAGDLSHPYFGKSIPADAGATAVAGALDTVVRQNRDQN